LESHKNIAGSDTDIANSDTFLVLLSVRIKEKPKGAFLK